MHPALPDRSPALKNMKRQNLTHTYRTSVPPGPHIRVYGLLKTWIGGWADPHWPKMLDPDPHWNQCWSVTKVPIPWISYRTVLVPYQYCTVPVQYRTNTVPIPYRTGTIPYRYRTVPFRIASHRTVPYPEFFSCTWEEIRTLRTYALFFQPSSEF